MKTFLRTKSGVVAMNGASVTGKWPESRLNDVIAWLAEIK
jgi:hypothetical protein